MPSSDCVVSVFGFEPSRIGGGETFARELSVQLGGRGWRSVLCFLRMPPEPVRRFLESPNVSFEVLPDSWKNGWAPSRGLFSILRRHRPRILHLHFTGFLSPYPWIARLAGTERVFFTDQSSRPEGYCMHRAPWWKRATTRAVNLPLDRVTCSSEYNRRSWLALDVLPEDRFLRIYNSVDVMRRARGTSEFRRKFSIPEGRPLVVQVSWVIPEKGFQDLLGAARIVIAAHPEVHFAFVGEGAWRQEYMRRTAEMGLEDHITWTGLVEDPVELGVYEDADIVCQVSRWEEAFGYVIAEAMASGKPVIGTRVGGIPEVIEDGRSGFVVPRGDVEAISGRILELLHDRELGRSMGRCGRAAAETRFNVERNVAELLQLYFA